ncbi:hypothetical protein J6590_038932 [Homalodisca vitripennis]|nr:hypothetical protein J6590_038932 [Homalodisca vitripennis]
MNECLNYSPKRGTGGASLCLSIFPWRSVPALYMYTTQITPPRWGCCIRASSCPSTGTTFPRDIVPALYIYTARRKLRQWGGSVILEPRHVQVLELHSREI